MTEHISRDALVVGLAITEGIGWWQRGIDAMRAGDDGRSRAATSALIGCVDRAERHGLARHDTWEIMDPFVHDEGRNT